MFPFSVDPMSLNRIFPLLNGPVCWEQVKANPLYTHETVKFQGEARIVKVPKMRAMTIAGLCLHIGITHETWCQYRKRDEAFSEVTATIDSIIRTQKFEGAAADLFNANIISRDLGLVDRQARNVDFGAKDSLAAIVEGFAQQAFTLASDSRGV
jgi:DNA-packaging protein gp3